MKSRNGLAKEQFSFFWRWQQRRCYLCRGRMAHPAGSSGRARLSATTDHTRPHCSGGRRRSNLVLAHRGCNERKGDRRHSCGGTAIRTTSRQSNCVYFGPITVATDDAGPRS